MDFINKYARFMRNTGPARVLVPIGIVLIVFGIITTMFFGGDMIETTGKVIGVEETVDSENKKEYDVTVSYTVDGKEYTGTFGGMGSGYNVGDEIKVFYDAENPTTISNTGSTLLFGLGAMALGLAALVLGILRTVKAVKKSRELDQTAGKAVPSADFSNYKERAGVKEIYCRYDGNTFKPGYILEDADRKVLYEGKMTKNALVGARTFEFTDAATGAVTEHEVGHTVTETFNNEFFSVKSSFKFDGKNIWDLLHERGLRMNTNLVSKFPNLIYEVSKNGEAYARIETSGQFVHEDEAAQHAVNIPVGKWYYRIWTDSEDYETIFLTVFGLSESEQAIAE